MKIQTSAPLGQAAAHGHGHLPRAQRPGLGQLPGVAVVEWVIFGNDTSKLHVKTSKHCEKSVRLTEKMACPARILGRMYKKGCVLGGTLATVAD